MTKNRDRWICKGNDYRRFPDQIIALEDKPFTDINAFGQAVESVMENDFIRLPLMDNTEALAFGGKANVINNAFL